MRPKSVIHAERAYLLSVVLLVAGTALIWQPLVVTYGVGVAAGSTAFLAGLLLLLVLLTTRRGGRVARWLLAIVSALMAGSLLWQIGTGQVALGLVGVNNTVQAILMVVGAVLLFRPNASAWFARDHAEWEEDA